MKKNEEGIFVVDENLKESQREMSNPTRLEVIMRKVGEDLFNNKLYEYYKK